MWGDGGPGMEREPPSVPMRMLWRDGGGGGDGGFRGENASGVGREKSVSVGLCGPP